MKSPEGVMGMPAHELERFLERVRRRWAAVALASAAARAFLLGALVLVLGAAATARVPDGGPPLVIVAAAALAALAGVVAWAFVPLRLWPRQRRVARFTEERVPGLEDRLTTAAELLEARPWPSEREGFAGLVVGDAAARVRSLQPSRVVPRSSVVRAFGRLALAAVLFGVAASTAVEPARRALEAVLGGLAGRRGGAETGSSDARVVASPPRVIRIDVEYEYPPQTGLAPRREEHGGDIYAPLGTRVQLHIETDRPVARGVLALGGGERLPLESRSARTLAGGLRVQGDTSYRVVLEASGGVRSEGDTEYFIRVVEDRPPEVRILRPAGDRRVTPLEEVVIEARAEDDYGIERFELVYSVRGREAHRAPLRGGGSATARTGSHLLYLEDLGVAPGDFVAYYARARDTGRFRRPVEARSDLYFLEVVPFDEEFTAAESAALGGGADQRSLESLIRAQKDVISATWKLDRRQAAGRSASDILAVARAQAELKRRAEAMRGADRRLGRGVGGPSRDGPGDDPVARAAEAMGRAQQSLEALDTTAALPHEMEALNALLRADAEVRRRQVARRQQASGGAGTGREQYDLSSLFDRELQRQQTSSYETRPSGETREDQRRDDPLKAIEELARRQNDVNRRLTELARGELDAAERERQLERLAREQEEIRREVEDLSRQLARGQAGGDPRPEPPSASPRGSASGEASPGARGRAAGRPVREAAGAARSAASRQARDAAAEMGGAARDLRRGELDRARERSARAAAELGEAAGTLRGADREPGVRALANELERARELRERIDALARRLADQVRQGPGSREGERGGRGRPDAEELARLEREYVQALRDARDLVDRMRVSPENAGRGLTPETHEYTMGAPGTEAFKQDYARWESLRRDVAGALERYELVLSAELAKQLGADRMQLDAVTELPEPYRALVARYYRALARKRP